MVSNIVQGMRLKSAGLALFASLALTACGGGGGSPGGVAQPPTMSLSVVDGNGNATTTVTTALGANVRAVVREPGGRVAAGVVVQLNAAGLIYTPTNGAAVTDGNGVATIGILADGTVMGAINIAATATVQEKGVGGNIGVVASLPAP